MVRMVKIKELGIGAAIAVLIFLAWQGYDIVPLILVSGFGVAVFFLAESKGLTKNLALNTSSRPKQEVTFADIGGQTTAIQELSEALDFIRSFTLIKELGIRPLKGILLTGPPGTGKTLMAKAAATFTDGVFIATSGSEFIEMYAGVGAQRVRKLFKSARDGAVKQGKSNAIIFIDEMDVLGGKRGRNSGHMEYDQTLNQLLVEMDGIKTDDEIKILLIAATNRVDMLDQALLRPGRFDRLVKVDLPDKEGRLQILKIHTRNKPITKDVSLESIARETFGFSGAQLESLANEAAIFALREKHSVISGYHFKEAIDKVMMGERLDKQPNLDELRRVAIHETGHALISEMLKPGSVSTLTITPRGNALGYMRQTPEDDTYLYTKEYLENQIAMLVAGAASEEIILGSKSTGAANDFEQAVKVAKKIILSGMSSLGIVSEESLPQNIQHKIITDIIKEQDSKAKLIMADFKLEIEHIVNLLLDNERLSGEEFRKLISAEKIINII